MKQDMSSADVAALVSELAAGPKSIIDAKIGKIYEGTSFMQLSTIAKLLIG